MSLVSLIGMLVYRFVISREANMKWGRSGVCFCLSIKFLVFSKFYVLGRGASCLIFSENNFAKF